MSSPFWLTDVQMARLQPFVPKSHGNPCVDDRRVARGGVFARMTDDLAGKAAIREMVMIDATGARSAFSGDRPNGQSLILELMARRTGQRLLRCGGPAAPSPSTNRHGLAVTKERGMSLGLGDARQWQCSPPKAAIKKL